MEKDVLSMDSFSVVVAFMKQRQENLAANVLDFSYSQVTGMEPFQPFSDLILKPSE